MYYQTQRVRAVWPARAAFPSRSELPGQAGAGVEDARARLKRQPGENFDPGLTKWAAVS